MYQKHRDDEDMQRENCNRLSDLAGDAEEEENATTKEKSAREEDEQQTRRKCAYGNAWNHQRRVSIGNKVMYITETGITLWVAGQFTKKKWENFGN